MYMYYNQVLFYICPENDLWAGHISIWKNYINKAAIYIIIW